MFSPLCDGHNEWVVVDDSIHDFIAGVNGVRFALVCSCGESDEGRLSLVLLQKNECSCVIS